jgi:hypothetical protein
MQFIIEMKYELKRGKSRYRAKHSNERNEFKLMLRFQFLLI